MCTDNMPSGTAMRLGDVLTIRGGTTVEVVNTDAEGRLVMADGIVLATEDRADAIVDHRHADRRRDAHLRRRVRAGRWATTTTSSSSSSAAGDAADEPVWQLPARTSATGPSSTPRSPTSRTWAARTRGRSPPALFLEEFTAGIPFGHLDICGPMMTATDDSWRSAGATGFGTRLLDRASPLRGFTARPADRRRAGAEGGDRAMTAAAAPQQKGAIGRLLDVIEVAGNKVPHPVLMFLYLIIGVIVLSPGPARSSASA